jgi:hypothetical protein
MISERTAAYVLAVVCFFQTLHPSWTIKAHCRRSIDVQIGWLRVQARNNAASDCYQESGGEQIPHIWEKEPRRLKICIHDRGCLTAWSDGTAHAWLLSKDKI